MNKALKLNPKAFKRSSKRGDHLIVLDICKKRLDGLV